MKTADDVKSVLLLSFFAVPLLRAHYVFKGTETRVAVGVEVFPRKKESRAQGNRI